jgi:hypothetical protein
MLVIGGWRDFGSGLAKLWHLICHFDGTAIDEAGARITLYDSGGASYGTVIASLYTDNGLVMALASHSAGRHGVITSLAGDLSTYTREIYSSTPTNKNDPGARIPGTDDLFFVSYGDLELRFVSGSGVPGLGYSPMRVNATYYDGAVGMGGADTNSLMTVASGNYDGLGTAWWVVLSTDGGITFTGQYKCGTSDIDEKSGGVFFGFGAGQWIWAGLAKVRVTFDDGLTWVDKTSNLTTDFSDINSNIDVRQIECFL